jgi:hypothetical protein
MHPLDHERPLSRCTTQGERDRVRVIMMAGWGEDGTLKKDATHPHQPPLEGEALVIQTKVPGMSGTVIKEE